MTDEAKAVKAKYAREWRKKNPGKSREYIARYWEKQAQKFQQEQEKAIAESKNTKAEVQK